MDKRTIDVAVISDVHLGTYGCKAKELTTYLRSISPGILILNGDFIDGWQFSRRYFPPAHISVIKELLSLMTKGTQVFYITGNHDELLRKYTDLHLGNFTLTDKLVLEIDKKMTWIFHGDVFDNTTKGGAKILARLGSSGYAFLILFNRFLNSILTFFGREKFSISRRVMAGFNKAISKINNLEAIATTIAAQKKYDFVICGHTHQPECSEVFKEGRKVTYLNSGDWIGHLTALEYNNHEWKIFRYEDHEYPLQVKSESPVEFSVLTDQINYYINKEEFSVPRKKTYKRKTSKIIQQK